jgi:hypothetical protein
VTQHMEALQKGNEVWRRRAQFKRELKSGEARLSEVLNKEIPDWLGTMMAEPLLLMAPRVGSRAVRSLLLQAQLGGGQEARHITTRQRLLLADELEKIEQLARKRDAA